MCAECTPRRWRTQRRLVGVEIGHSGARCVAVRCSHSGCALGSRAAPPPPHTSATCWPPLAPLPVAVHFVEEAPQSARPHPYVPRGDDVVLGGTPNGPRACHGGADDGAVCVCVTLASVAGGGLRRCSRRPLRFAALLIAGPALWPRACGPIGRACGLRRAPPPRPLPGTSAPAAPAAPVRRAPRVQAFRCRCLEARRIHWRRRPN